MIRLPSPARWILAFYAWFSGLLVCCLETQLPFLRIAIAMNFGFLFNFVARFLFYLLMSSIAISFDDLLGRITSGVLVGTAFYNTYVLYRYPSYKKIRDKIAEEEDKKIRERINQQVRKQAVKELTRPSKQWHGESS